MSFGLSGAAWAAIAAAAVAAAGTGLSVSQQADAQKKQAEYQAQVAANNAQIEKWQRSSALQKGEQEASRALQEQSQLLTSQRAALAANGVDVTQGSALDVLATTRFLGAQEQAAIQSNAAREAWGYDVSGQNQRNESAFSNGRARSINQAAQGGWAGGQSLLSSAASYGAAGGFSGGGSGVQSVMKVRPGSGTGWV